MPRQRYITGSASNDSMLEYQLSMLCNSRLHLDSIIKALERIPSYFEVDDVVPTGKFWIVGPASNGLCFAYQDGGLYSSGEVTVHRYSDLVNSGFAPIHVIAHVER